MSTICSDDYPPEPSNFGSMPFRLFVKFLDRLESPDTTPTHRKEIVKEIVSLWRQKCGKNIFPCFRLLLPESDSARIFRLKEKKLALEILQILHIDRKSEDGQAMLNWKGGYMAGTGDFPRRCRENILKRHGKKEYSNLNLDDINELLDDLVRLHTQKGGQKKVLEMMIKKLNAHEIYWMIKIIIKSMKIRMTEKSILDCWHPDAIKSFNVNSDLRRVCWELLDENSVVNTVDIQPFLCYKPQMANFAMKDYSELLSKINSPEFYIEEKIDGERLQLHMVNDEFRYFSRKGNDNTEKYGKNYSSGSFTPLIKNFLHPNVRSIVLDGEIVSWNEVECIVEGFSRVKGAINMIRNLESAVGIKKSFHDDEYNDTDKPDPAVKAPSKWRSAIEATDNNFHRHPFYIVYDILYMNGVSFLSYPLKERRRVLETVLKPVNHVIEIIKYTKGSTKDDIDKRFMDVMEKDGEGLVIKNPDSAYRLNSRNNDWVKVKPEYISNLGENLDLLIIGGYYGNGSRAGGLSSFLCGVRYSLLEQEDEHIDDDNTSFIPPFYSFCKVGGGFANEEYEIIRSIFKDKTVPFTSNDRLPPCLDFGNQAPDVWIHPKDSIVIQIKAGQITVSDSYKAGMTLRFPRFTGFRYDKNWKNATSLNQLKQIRADIEAKRAKQQHELQKRKSGNAGKRSIKRVKLNIVSSSREYTSNEDLNHTASSAASSSLFKGKRFYVLTSQRNPAYKSVKQLEILINTHSGSTIAFYPSISDTTEVPIYVIADIYTVGVSSFIKSHPEAVIVRPKWLWDSVQDKKIRPLNPEYILTASEEEIYKAKCNVDRYGDNYYEASSVESLKPILSRMTPYTTRLNLLVPSKDGSTCNQLNFHKLLGAFSEMFQDHFHNDMIPLNMLFASCGTIYFDFEQQSQAYILDIMKENSTFRQKESNYDPIAPTVTSLKAEAELDLVKARFYTKFGGAVIETDPSNPNIDIMVFSPFDTTRVRKLKEINSKRRTDERFAYCVDVSWIFASWRERTLLSEDLYTISDI